ncbi:hypothetical protein ACLVWQ_24335 [Streptomyces sp. CWNU-52B]
MSLDLSLASSDLVKKQILDSFGTTIEEFDELFGHGSGSIGPHDD